MVCLTKPISHSFFSSATHNSAAFGPPLSYRNFNSQFNIFGNSNKEPNRRKAVQSSKKSYSLQHIVKTQGKRVVNGGVTGANDKVWVLCGFGYWLQGFRCFPWLALNFHLVNDLNLSPSTLQLVQNTGNLPMVAKPLFGVLSDAVYIGGAHRIPYISIGAFLQLMSWATLARVPVTGELQPTQMACILISNLGASFAEVASDALVAEFSKNQKVGKLQSYAFIALAAGALLGNLSGGFVLLKSQEPKVMFGIFSLLLLMQLSICLTTKERLSYSSYGSNNQLPCSSLCDNLKQQLSSLITVISEEAILYPLSWIVASVAIVPILSGSMFCFQTQCLKLDPSIIGLSKVFGQLMVLSATVFYERYLKGIPMRSFICGTQILYALSILSDFILVKQINVKFGIPNEAYVLCLAALAEAIAQFKLLPFTVLFSRICPPGCEGSLFAFFASAMCLSSILSGILGVGLGSLVGVSSGDFSCLPIGILVQFISALLPLCGLSFIPNTRFSEEMQIVKTR